MSVVSSVFYTDVELLCEVFTKWKSYCTKISLSKYIVILGVEGKKKLLILRWL